MTYNELRNLCHKNEVAFRIALQESIVYGLSQTTMILRPRSTRQLSASPKLRRM